VLVGLAFVRGGYPKADSIAALFVAAIVLGAASRLAFRNADILMDRSPRKVDDAVRNAISGLDPPIELKRVRVREAGGHYFAEAIIGVSPEAVVGEGHAAADEVERAVQNALPGTDVVVHVEPSDARGKLIEAVRVAAMSVRGVREIHNLTLVKVEGKKEVTLHLKLPADLSLEEAHTLASQVERAITSAVPEISGVQTHLEPLIEATIGASLPPVETELEAKAIESMVRAITGFPPRALRFVRTDEGLIAYLTLALNPEITLAQAHEQASEIERSIHRERPEIAELVVHTEP
jgi:divalent metal cation (Fe/Co/Zn/Cd) transporter